MENFQAVLECGADVEVTDQMGRTALHWASVGGMAHVFNHIISLSRDLVDWGNVDGWTPLIWAARSGDNLQTGVSPSAQEEVIKLLLDLGADSCVRTTGLDREWSPVKVARYHGVDNRVIRLLEKKAKEKLEATRADSAWDEKFHASRKAAGKDGVKCDCCFLVRTLWLIPPAVFIAAPSILCSPLRHLLTLVWKVDYWNPVPLRDLLELRHMLQVLSI